MVTIKRNIKRILRSSSDTRKEARVIVWTLLKVQLMVWIMPLRFYYSTYFKSEKVSIPDVQLFQDKIGLYNRILGILPIRISCLVRSLSLYDILKRYDIINPVHVGIRAGFSIEAHAWNEHQKVQNYFKID